MCIFVITSRSISSCNPCTGSTRSVTILAKKFQTSPYVAQVTTSMWSTWGETTCSTSTDTMRDSIPATGLSFFVSTQPAVLLRAPCTTCNLTRLVVHSAFDATWMAMICTVVICEVISNPQARTCYRRVWITVSTRAADVVISIWRYVGVLVNTKFV